MLSNLLNESERRRDNIAFYFSLSLVIDSCRFIRERSG